MLAKFVEECRTVLFDVGLAPEDLIADGTLQRCRLAGKKTGRDGAYTIHTDPPYSLWWTNWCTGDSGTHTAHGQGMQGQANAQHMAQVRQAREADQAARHRAAMERAKSIWEKSRVANDEHPYLKRKNIVHSGTRVTTTGSLIIPVLSSSTPTVKASEAIDYAQHIQSLQFIATDGSKKFLTDGKIAGGFYRIPAASPDGERVLCVTEGYATAGSIHLATGYACYAALSAKNLVNVARMLRAQYPDYQIVICADNDAKSSTNVGLKSAQGAVQACGGLLAMPPSNDNKSCDFNDLHVAKGLDAVKEIIEQAKSHPRNISIVSSRPLPQVSDPVPYPVSALGCHADLVSLIASHVATSEVTVANGALATLSLCAQGVADIVVESRNIPLSLYFLTVAESGDRKSSVDAIISAGIRRYEREALTAYEDEIKLWDKEIFAYDSAKKALSRGRDHTKIFEGLEQLGDPPVMPRSPRLLVSDLTVQGLYRQYQVGCHSLGVFSDEGGTLFGGNAFLSANKLQTLAFFSTLWSRGCADKVRLGEGASSIEGQRMASHIMVQPTVFAGQFNNQLLHEQGFFPRFLMASPPSLRGTRTKISCYSGDIQSDPLVMAFYDTCVRLLKSWPDSTDPDIDSRYRKIKLSQEATSVYLELYNKTELGQSLDGEFAAIPSYASRCAEQALRIAGVLTLASDPTADTVSGETMARAAELALWYLREAARMINDGGVSEEMRQAHRLLRWLKTYSERYGERFVTTKRMLQHTRLADVTEVRAALSVLEQYGHVRPAPNGTIVDGHPSSTAWEYLGNSEKR